jgi:microcystin-dependent protein
MTTFTDGQILTASQLNSVVATTVPAGVIVPYAGASAPTNWLLCDGSAVSRSTYSVLFAVTSTQFGVGNGTTTFNLPDLRGRVPVGIDTGQSEFNVRGETGGAKTHTLTTSEMPSHSHTITTFGNAAAVEGGFFVEGLVNAGTRGTNNTGGGAAHNNLQPYIALQYIIKT